MNTKHVIISLGIVCAALWGGSGCTNSIAPITTPQEVIPLKVGNEWNYEVANYLPAFNDTLYRQYSSRIVRDTMIEGKQHFVRHSFGSFFYSIIVINLPDGYYSRENNRYSLIRKYPVRLNEIYQLETFDLSGNPIDTLDCKVTALDKEVSVQAGKFRCYEEQYFVGSDKYVSHIAPGHGWIEGLTYDSTNTLVARTQLTSYTIQK